MECGCFALRLRRGGRREPLCCCNFASKSVLPFDQNPWPPAAARPAPAFGFVLFSVAPALRQ